ncbi:MAG: DegT/DnrJ/EryC1/StrS family aminotransferase, partial [Candidatus Hydrogenedentes bacterium]|nr:DegT/DnrJ/EryC1/StrS family aminotransferase [Candidatus Hydrogenedentota bacterium]
MSTDAANALAINGGKPVRTEPFPPRNLFTEEEKQAAAALFDKSIASGGAFGYNGEEEEAYCREFAAFLGGGYADAVNSGTNAVYVALRALDLEPFTEVIVPCVTDMGGVMPVPLMNCIPVPADVAPGSYNMGPEQVEARITDRTSAIVVAHISGLPADMDPILEIAKAKGIPVVEDCAQAHGAKYKGRLVGTMGDVAAFSTMSGKHHATGAQGGVVFTKSEETYWKARRAADRGKPFNVEGSTGNVTCGLNCNLNELSAAIGRVQLRKLPAIVEGCRRAGMAVAERCQGLKAVEVDTGVPGAESAFWFVVFRLDPAKVSVDIDTFVQALQAEGLPFAGHYTTPFTRHDWFRNRAVFGTSGYPWACPLYTGDPDREYPLPNFDAVDGTLFRIKVHENCGDLEAEQIAAALGKAEAAFL